MQPFENTMRKGGAAAIAEATRFFMKDDRVHKTLYAIATRLGDLQIPYAIAGGMALVAHGYDRTTEDVDILIPSDAIQRVHDALDGLGYVRPFAASKNLRDAATGVRIEFLIAGQYPGDGIPKPVKFPAPDGVAVDIDGIKYLQLTSLVELKLASGMTKLTRVKDLGDVVELIRLLKIPREFSDKLNPFVREKFLELWAAVQADSVDE